MAIGTIAELFLLGHYEDRNQLIPIVLIGLSMIVFIIHQFGSNRIINRLFIGMMIGCVFSGFFGIGLHLKANLEFETEMHPSYSDWDIFVNSLSGALPALAPGSMIMFGIIGYLYILLNHKN